MSKKREQQLKKQRKREREAAKQKKQRMQMLALITAGVLVLVVIGVVLYMAATGGSGDTQDGTSENGGETTAGTVDFNYDEQPRLGQADAPVKIVEFGDFRCPTCKQYHEQFVPQLKEDFIDTGKAAYYFINLPILGEGSLRAALAAESVQAQRPNADGYWDYHDAIFANQGAEDDTWATTEFLVQLAEEHVPDIDTEQLKKDIEEQTYVDQVNADMQKGERAGVSGTPTVFVNGQLLDQDQTFQYQLLKEAINEAYEKAAN